MNAEFCGMIGRAPVMQELFGLIRRLAPHARTVLITGETGSGKELVARALHRCGPRSGKRFVTINCSAVVETLFESELFGHARGAFTGATDNKPGLFEVANGGTLFLDEIGELPQTMQAKLLRVLETGEVQRVGSVDTDERRRARRCGDQPRPAQRVRRRPVPQRSVLPAERRGAARACRCASGVRTFRISRRRSSGTSAARLRKKIVGLTPSAERMLISAAWEATSGSCATSSSARAFSPTASSSASATSRAACRRWRRPPSSLRVSHIARNCVAEGGDTLSHLERDHIIDVLARAGGNKAKAARDARPRSPQSVPPARGLRNRYRRGLAISSARKPAIEGRPGRSRPGACSCRHSIAQSSVAAAVARERFRQVSDRIRVEVRGQRRDAESCRDDERRVRKLPAHLRRQPQPVPVGRPTSHTAIAGACLAIWSSASPAVPLP